MLSRASRRSIAALRNHGFSTAAVQNPYKHLSLPAINSIKWETTSYDKFALKPHIHPGEWKVKGKVAVTLLELDETATANLKMIAGSRYNANRNELTLTSEKFESRMENKNYLISTLDKMVQGATTGEVGGEVGTN